MPSDETARLDALRRYAVLDTPAEQAFDDLTLIAAQICQVPTALVSLVDQNRQWFKARRGLDLMETPREVAFCAHTILHADEVFEVRDAHLDPRFAQYPLVTGDAKVRFYAGAPLVTPGGHAVGALCVMDQQPRALTPEQREALRALGRRVVDQLELRRQARELALEFDELEVAERHLQERCRQLADSERAVSAHLVTAERARRALLSVLEDETAAGKKLRESEERFRQLAENIDEVFWIADPTKSRILYVSPAYETIWGRTCRSLYESPQTWLDAIHSYDRNRVIEAARHQVRGDYCETYRILRPDGGMRWIRDRAVPVRGPAGDVYRVVGTAVDVTEIKQAEIHSQLQHEITVLLAEGTSLAQTARRILESLSSGMGWSIGALWLVDQASQRLSCAELWHQPGDGFAGFAAATRRLKFAAGEGLPGRVWSARAPIHLTDLASESGFVRRNEAVACGAREALAFPIMVRTEVHGVAEFFSTVATVEPEPTLLARLSVFGSQIGQFIERKHLEEQFRQAQKMEAIGTLAGGIAHDFNNVLGAISGYTELARGEAQGNPDLQEYLQAVAQGSERAAGLVRQILAFSRVQEQERKSLQLAPILDEALKLLRATIPRTIDFEVKLERGGPPVLADPTQMHQVIMNLATNAAHAMRGRTGRLAVSLETLAVDAGLAAVHPGLRPGPYRRIVVADTGHGMDAATLRRIFDPFFTTKAPGEGTGLGLAVVHGIVQSHDGVIVVESELGSGTRFQIYLPAYSTGIEMTDGESAAVPRGRGQRVLLVDDEKPLLSLGKRMLERLGYVCDGHLSPVDALRAFRADPASYALLITDLTMPGMTGLELAQEILGSDPDFPILLTTGFSAGLTGERARAAGLRDMLLKPLKMQALGEAVHRALATVPKE